MRTTEMKIAIPDGGRFNSVEVTKHKVIVKFEVTENVTVEKSLECRIDPMTFVETLCMKHTPATERQFETMNLFLDAKIKGRLHPFTCMRIDPSIQIDTSFKNRRKLVYEKALNPAVGYSQVMWEEMLKSYCPNRNSRQLTRTEYSCRNLFIIQELINSGYEIDAAWSLVCDDSSEIGHYSNSNNANRFSLKSTGSQEVCGFYDLGNTCKLLAQDPWEEDDGFWVAGGDYQYKGYMFPIADLYHSYDFDLASAFSVGMLALD